MADEARVGFGGTEKSRREREKAARERAEASERAEKKATERQRKAREAAAAKRRGRKEKKTREGLETWLTRGGKSLSWYAGLSLGEQNHIFREYDRKKDARTSLSAYDYIVSGRGPAEQKQRLQATKLTKAQIKRKAALDALILAVTGKAAPAAPGAAKPGVVAPGVKPKRPPIRPDVFQAEVGAAIGAGQLKTAQQLRDIQAGRGGTASQRQVERGAVPAVGSEDWLEWYLINELGVDPAAAAAIASGLSSGDGGGTTRQPFTAPAFQPTPEEEIRVDVRTGFQRAMGRSPTPEESQAYVQMYREMEKRYHAQTVSASRAQYEGAPSEGVIEQLPGPGALAFERERVKSEAGEFGFLNVMGVFDKMVSS